MRRAASMTLVAPALVAGLVLLACGRKTSDASEGYDAALPPAPTVVPPAAPFNATPVAELGDAGDLDTQPPYEQAKVFHKNGQLWMARLVLEQKALGPDGTRSEAELLLEICQAQADAACVEACGRKLGRKIKLDAGAAKATPAPAPEVGGEHNEPDSELSRARDLILKMQYEPARRSLEPRVLDGKASREEIRMLRTVCQKQGDRMCVALCDSKLK